MTLSEARSRGLFKIRVDIAQFFDNGGLEMELVFREPTFQEIEDHLGATDDKQKLSGVKSLLPKCLLDHPFTNEDGSKATAETVFGLLAERASLYSYVAAEWQEKLPLGKVRSGSSAK